MTRRNQPPTNGKNQAMLTCAFWVVVVTIIIYVAVAAPKIIESLKFVAPVMELVK